ncbi:glycosyltransferase [Candidatus Micrarchaeota archaeon]|nr:glycosyltransferase [Candidatus Micrarchaeota archaeon]
MLDLEEKQRVRIGLGRRLAFPLVLATVIIVFASIYLIIRASTLFSSDYGVFERLWAMIFLVSELFIFLNILGFLLSILKSTANYKTVTESYFAPYSNESVSCFICSYNEPLEILEETILSVLNVNYENKELILLDDSTGELAELVRSLGKKYSLRVIQRYGRPGFKAGALNNGLKYVNSKYIAVFDTDQKPTSNFLKDLVYLLERDEKMALIQTPQFYVNTQNPIALAAWNRQRVFYEYICEGKSTSNAMFCCGSNFIARRRAIDDVGGFDATTVTEDFATTFNLHKKGWKTLYYNLVYVRGLGPETLPAYFAQQYRWAHGTVTVFKRVIISFIKNPFQMKPQQWWEYFLSSTYFFTGWSNFVFMLAPMAFLIFGIRPLMGDAVIYLVSFIPYFVLSLLLFVYSMGKRGYGLRDILLSQSIALTTFNVYMVADVEALVGLPAIFNTTHRGVNDTLSLRLIWPQMSMILLSIVALMVGLLSSGGLVVWINMFWAFYHLILLSYLFLSTRKIL